VSIRLFNATLVERVLAWWAGQQQSDSRPANHGAGNNCTTRTRLPVSVRRGLRRAVSAAKTSFPGNKFQLVARRRRSR
jgi:hypothetical protein